MNYYKIIRIENDGIVDFLTLLNMETKDTEFFAVKKGNYTIGQIVYYDCDKMLKTVTS